MKSKVLLHGMHRSKNFGDVLLTQILRDHLLKNGDNELILLAPREELAGVLRLRAAGISDFLASDTLILGGGGFFQRVDGPLGSLKAIMRYALPLLLAQILGKRTAIIGAGAAAMPRGWLDFLFKRIVKGCDMIAVRDQASFDYITALLGSDAVEKIHRVSDLAFSVEQCWLGEEERAWAADVIRNLGTSRVLGIHLSEPPSANPSYEEIAALLESHLALQPDTGVLLLEDHPVGPIQQAAAQAELQRRLPNSEVLIVPYPGVERLAALLASMDAVLTTKLHVALCAASMGTMPFAVAKHRKNLASFADIGIVSSCCLLDEADSDQIAAIVSSFVRHEGALIVDNDVRNRARKALELASAITQASGDECKLDHSA